ncbi:hypothetical protein E2C01_089331 [Portunus trituberculatus]|uniref:Uncharacterized protein n=1 Tax=Portunus trituberculatus TaxID=210409 RepID=A0A5B7JHW2_PORTR|nr:hypothetical protein [Portunus trituberculatus]
MRNISYVQCELYNATLPQQLPLPCLGVSSYLTNGLFQDLERRPVPTTAWPWSPSHSPVSNQSVLLWTLSPIGVFHPYGMIHLL